MNKKTIIILVICLLVVAASVGFVVWDYKKGKADKDPAVEPETPAATPSVFPLKKGSKNDYVKSLQAKMNAYIAYHWFALKTKPSKQRIAEDGDFGPKTLEFVLYIFKTSVVTEAMYTAFMGSVIGNVTETTKKDWIINSPYSFLKI